MLKTYLNDTYWIFNHPQPETIPSYIVSGLMPAEYLGIKKIIFLENHDAEAFLNRFNPKCLILSKSFGKNLSTLSSLAKKKGITVISLFDDWNFENNNRSEINLPIAKNSDLIISKTVEASKEIKKYTDLDSIVIPDPIRFRSYPIFSNLGKPLKACWFGMHSNHNTIMNELASLDDIDIEINLTIITNYLDNLYDYIDNKNFKNINIKLIKWNTNSDKDITNNDLVLLPYPSDKKRLVKSSNRIIESLNLGRFTILSNVKQFAEFKNYTYFGNLNEGIKWLLNNPKEAMSKTIKGQNYVKENYSLERICKLWSSLLENFSKS